MTTAAGLNDAVPEGAPPATTAQQPAATRTRLPNQDGKQKERPRTILELVEHAYGEAGRKLNFARRDLDQLSVEPNAKQAEEDAIKRLAKNDPDLAVPLSLLTTLGDLGENRLVFDRLLELVELALVTHPLFKKGSGELNDFRSQAMLTAREVCDAAEKLSSKKLGVQVTPGLSAATPKRLQVNAITAYGLFRVLRNDLSPRQFIEDMTDFVWRGPNKQDPHQMAAILASAKNAEALSQLALYFKRVVGDAEREADVARAQTARLERRVAVAEEGSRQLTAELQAERQRAAELVAEVKDLTKQLTAEEDNRVIDRSHLVNDYEVLRTQVIRRLSAQVGLLGDGLHALQNGSLGVAEEFVDRALSAINREISNLRDLNGGER